MGLWVPAPLISIQHVELSSFQFSKGFQKGHGGSPIPGWFKKTYGIWIQCLVGGLEHGFYFVHLLGMSSSQLTFIFIRGVETTSQF